MTTAVTSRSADAIPFLDLVSVHRALEEELVERFRQALRNASFVGGDEVEAFEREFAAYVEREDSVALNSGTDALRFAYMAMGMRPGNEVITVAHTFIATTESVTQAGGVFRFVDVDPHTMTIDVAQIESAIGPRTVGIVPVHLYGQPADMDPILDIARRRHLWVVEDAAQAHGARYRGRSVGTLADMAAFSFYPGKNLGACGEGGAVTGSDPAALALVRRIRDHGQSQKYVHEIEGYNGRLDAIQAAFLRVKLRRLAQWNEQRREVAAQYRSGLADVPEIQLPIEAAYARHVYHLFVIRADCRDALREHLAQERVGTGLHYPIPLHLQPAYEGLSIKRGALPVTERAAQTVLSLPMFPSMTAEQVTRVVEGVRSFYGR